MRRPVHREPHLRGDTTTLGLQLSLLLLSQLEHLVLLLLLRGRHRGTRHPSTHHPRLHPVLHPRLHPRLHSGLHSEVRTVWIHRLRLNAPYDVPTREGRHVLQLTGPETTHMRRSTAATRSVEARRCGTAGVRTHKHPRSPTGRSLLHVERVAGVRRARLTTHESERGISTLIVLEGAHVVWGRLLARLRLREEWLVDDALMHVGDTLAEHVGVLHVHRGRQKTARRGMRASPTRGRVVAYRTEKASYERAIGR